MNLNPDRNSSDYIFRFGLVRFELIETGDSMLGVTALQRGVSHIETLARMLFIARILSYGEKKEKRKLLLRYR